MPVTPEVTMNSEPVMPVTPEVTMNSEPVMPVNPEVTMNSEPVMPVNPSVAMYSEPSVPDNYSNTGMPNKKSNNKNILFIIGGVVLAIVVIAVALVLFGNKKLSCSKVELDNTTMKIDSTYDLEFSRSEEIVGFKTVSTITLKSSLKDKYDELVDVFKEEMDDELSLSPDDYKMNIIEDKKNYKITFELTAKKNKAESFSKNFFKSSKNTYEYFKKHMEKDDYICK